MKSLKSFALAGGLMLGAAFAANAADLPPPPPLEPHAPAAYASEFSGWYLRGDVGVGGYRNPKVGISPAVPVVPVATAVAGDVIASNFYGQNLGMATFVGAGVGYQFNNWLRFDVTAEYRGSSAFSAIDSYSIVGLGGTANPDTLRNFYKGNLSSFVAMANGYVDLGTWHRITPYVGAGVGVAYNMVHGLTDQGFRYNYDPGIPGYGPGAPTGGFARNGAKTSFAWALMAGLGYDVTQNLKLEVGYRYLNLGSARSGTISCFSAAPGFAGCAGNSRMTIKNIESHDFKLGMRWLLDSPAPAPAPVYAPPPPMIRKG